MTGLFKRCSDLQYRRKQSSLERWERIRAKGKARFVLHQALTWTVFMTALRDVSDQIFEGGGQVSNLRFHIVIYSLTGIFVGLFAWWSQEGKYKNALLNRRVQAAFDNQLTPR